MDESDLQRDEGAIIKVFVIYIGQGLITGILKFGLVLTVIYLHIYTLHYSYPAE